jgi:pyridoxamine 5'-phosphate oxidase
MLSEMRKSYELAELGDDALTSEPMEFFKRWLDEALKSQIPEPNAMTLATVDSQLQPSTRIVLLKGLDEGLIFYTNYQSRKGLELAGNPKAALQFHWVELERTVRVEGLIEKTSEALSDAYFSSRPRGSQIGAWASPQSAVLTSREQLQAEVTRLEQHYANQIIPRPEHWGGYRLRPQAWEFWQGRPSRLHDRIRYVRLEETTQSAWSVKRLGP